VTYLHSRFLFTQHLSASAVPRHFYETKETNVYHTQTTKYFTGLEKTETYFRLGPIWPERVLEIYRVGIRIITLTVETKQYSNKIRRNSSTVLQYQG
jgi:hypothetical protein